jgi:hypothetical protein
LKKIIDKIKNWEAWPFKLIYAPLVPIWAWNMIRSGSVWFFTPSNPKLTFGGMEGEPKREMYDLLPTHLYPITINILPNTGFEKVIEVIAAAKIEYPFVVKPEVGGQGILFRKIDTEAQLRHYHSKMKFEYIVQAMIHYPMEVSVFHIRYPNKTKGEITGFLHKVPLQVMGNGINTLYELVMQHPKGYKRVEELQPKHQQKWNVVLPEGEKYVLSYAANHNRGAHFIDLKNEIDDTLLAIFDKLSIEINDFFYGRYDILCTNVADLKQGQNFSILEYNGCGAEPNHFYDTGYTLGGAYKEILKHWKALYEISKYNKQQGIKPWPFMKGMKFRKWTRDLYANMKIVDEEIG